MSATVTLSRNGPIALWVTRDLVAIPLFIAAVLLVVQISALGLDLADGSLGDLPVKGVVLTLTLFILWVRSRPHWTEATAP